MYYTLKNGKPKACTCEEWTQWFEQADNRRIDRTVVGDLHVSTVFLGLDHSFGHGPPILYETMVFNNHTTTKTIFDKPYEFHESHDEFFRRYSTLGQAKIGHQETVNALRQKQGENHHGLLSE